MTRRTIGRLCGDLGIAALTVLVVLVVLVGASRGNGISGVREAVGKYEQDVVRWEVAHFLDKWTYLATSLFLDRSGEEKRQEAVAEFFTLGERLRAVRGELESALAAPDEVRARSPEAVQADVDAIQRRRDELAPVVEETLEAVISGVLSDLDIIDRFGPVRWPPVDFTFEDQALLLVRSPRDEIVRLEDVLLRPNVNLIEQTALESTVEGLDDNTSALVVRLGGLATYPAHVSPHLSLQGTLAVASHEWLHHWLFFRPLGRSWFAGGELTSINETVANLFAEEAGDLAYARLTGEIIERAPWQPPAIRQAYAPPDDVFDFTREMRRTRTRLEGLLEEAGPDAAEAYLEERRLEFVANGFNIRKLNNAWFAFNGTYAGGPASISPIEGQLRTVRAASASLAEFLDSMSGITQPGQLEQMALEAGWVPIAPGP